MGSTDRRPYETATTLDQALLDECAGNLVNDLRMTCTIAVPTGAFVTDTLYLSDRNMIVGENYYQARIKFPPINANVGELLEPTITWPNLTLEINNVDGYFNPILPGSAFYDSFVNREVIIKLGLGEVQSTYDANIIFSGLITEVGGFSRTTKTWKIIARNKFDSLKATFPTTTFSASVYPDIGDNVKGQIIPIAIGDFTTNLEVAKGASVPAFVVNGADANMNGETSHINNVKLVITENTNRFFDNTHVVLQRSDLAYVFDSADILNIHANKNYFEIDQNGTTLIEGAAYEYKTSDKFFVKIRGVSIDGPNTYADNAVEQARYILKTYGGALTGDFASAWDTIRDKASPSQSAIFTIKSRVYRQKPRPALVEALSLLEQVRCEAYTDRSQSIALQTIHWEDFVPAPSFVIENSDIELNSFRPALDQKTNYNRLQGFYNRLPDIKEEYQATEIRENSAAVAQQGKNIEKGLVFPNLYIDSEVQAQVDEYLKITSGLKEDITATQTWRSINLDLGDWVSMNVQIQSVEFVAVPCWVRSVSFSSIGMKITIKYFSFQNLPFETWNPGYSGIVGGQNATITKG